MRILIVSEDIPYPNMGGLAKHALSLARALIEMGHEVDILGGDQHPLAVCGEEGAFNGYFFGELGGHNAGWKEKQFGVFMPVRRTWVARHFANIVMRRANNYDVIHYHGHVPNIALHIPPHVNFIQTRHDQGSECLTDVRFRNGDICTSIDAADCASCKVAQPNLLQRQVSKAAVIQYRREVANSFKRHKTVFVSHLLRSNFSRALGPGHWGAVVHNFINLQAIQNAHAAASERSTDATEKTMQVFIAGKLYAGKGVGAFLQELAPQLPPPMQVTIAGDGPDEATLRANYASEQVNFLGWCAPDKTLQLAASATAIVMPSLLEESFGSSTLEGILLGKPTFALARGGTLELSMYAGSSDQLRLHEDMPALVRDLISFIPRVSYGPAKEKLAGAERALQELLQLYRLPPGPILKEDKVNHASHSLNHHLHLE